MVARGKVYKHRPAEYPRNWRDIAKKVEKRDEAKCFECGKSKDEVRALGMRLETHHIQSVRSGNNRKTNLIKVCSKCHSKQPGHNHLKSRK